MKTLAIETSSDTGSVACVADGRAVCERVFKEGMAHGRDLVKEMDECVREAGWERGEVELLAVSVGPGSYTGLRVGVAAAKALCYALQVPVSAVCSLDVIAENGPRAADHVAVVVDARRGEVYGALYVNVGFSFFREVGPVVVKPEEFAGGLPRPVFLLGDGIVRYREAFRKTGFECLNESLWRPKAINVGLLGEKIYLTGERIDPAALAPLYLRLPEAEEKWRTQHGGQAAGAQ